MASTPVSSMASSATNVADVLASLGDHALAAEVGSWLAELQAKVVAAVSAISTTSAPSPASTVVRRRKGTKLDTASSSAAASWLDPAVEPAALTAELDAIQEGERSPAATTVADEEVINFGAMQAPLGNPPAAGGAIGPILMDPAAAALTVAATAALRAATAPLAARPRRLLPTAFLTVGGGDDGPTLAPTTLLQGGRVPDRGRRR